LFSSIVVVISVISLATNGLDEGVDFGGRTFQVRFEKPIETETVKELAKVLDGSAEVKIL
jgi:SecD/SecF fusion protein